MGKELYVGSLSYDTTEYDLEKLFSVSGRVTSIHLITDNKTGQFKGCGYVRMSTEAEAKDAILSLDGAMLIDRTITVSMANPQKQKQQGGYKGKPGGPSRSDGSSSRSSAAGKPGAAKSSLSAAAPAKAGFPKPGGPKSSKPAPAKGGNSRTGKR